MSAQRDGVPDACGVPVSAQHSGRYLPAELYGLLPAERDWVLPAKLYGILPAEHSNLAVPDAGTELVSDEGA
jgi:hypothetical protein